MHVASAEGLYFVTEAVNLMSPAAMSELLARIQQLPEPPALIVFDTFARCLIGGDENSASDVGLAIAHADRLRVETGAAVLLLHHVNAGGERERGSTALRGACDGMFSLKAEDGILTLACEKMKDDAPFPDLRLQLVPTRRSMLGKNAA